MILVTGAAGHLGANLVRRLLRDGAGVRVLLRTEAERATVRDLPAQAIVGDVRDADAVWRAVEGCAQIYHCAALVSTVDRDHQALFDCNVLGTRNVLRAALAAGAERVVVSGSFSATGHLPNRPSDESVPFNPLDRHLPYSHTKAAVEHECLKAHADGLAVVVAVSTAILGPWDFMPSRMGRVLLRFAAGELRAYVPGGFEFVSASDIAEGHVLAMARGRPGQKYIFATEFLTFDQIIAMFGRVTGQARHPVRVPPGLMLAAAAVTGRVMSVVAPRREQLLNSAAIRILRMGRRADTTRAREELGFRPGSVEAAVAEAHQWFQASGFMSERRRPAAAGLTAGALP